MYMDLNSSMEILEEYKISPPQNSVETTKFPLTFFDVPWILSQPVERILFYELPHPTIFITESILPQLKQSLSLALQQFLPLVGSLVLPPLPMEPYILYQNGNFFPLTIAQSNSDFHHLVQNYPKNASDFSPLIPHLSNEIGTLFSSDDDQVPTKVFHPLIALKVTIFPNSGISICLTYRHVVGDGRTMNNFIKSWASLSKSKNDLSVIAPQPFHDRTTINKNSNELVSLLCKQWHESGVSWDSHTTFNPSITSSVKVEDKFHATFVLGSHEIGLLRNCITSRFHDLNEPSPLPYVSTFVVTCAFILVCLVKTQNIYAENNASTDDSVVIFVFSADVTEKPELKVPKTYIGNCLAGIGLALKKSELMSENGLLIAAKAIMQKIKEHEKSGFLDNEAKKGLPPPPPPPPKVDKMKSSLSFISVAGSPKLQAYETDFGWGKPRKSEVVHINKGDGSIALTESRDEKGGIEVGISLNKADMEVFHSIFDQGLKNYMA